MPVEVHPCSATPVLLPQILPKLSQTSGTISAQRLGLSKPLVALHPTNQPSKLREISVGRQHPSPNVKTLCNFEPRLWPEIITSRDAKNACLKAQGCYVK